MVGRISSRAGIIVPMMIRMLAVALAAILSGCGDTVPIHVLTVREDPDDDALLDEAAAILGIDWEPTTYTRGAVVLTLVDATDEDTIGGGAADRPAPCFRPAVSTRRAVFVAHELGHALGLEHVCGINTDTPCTAGHESNLMKGEDPVDGTDLTDEQQDTVDKEARRLARCANR